MSSYVLGFEQIDRSKTDVVGGKGANLGELSRITGIHVPEGFCITTDAFKRVIGETPSIGKLLDQLSVLKTADRDRVRKLGGEIRKIIEGITIPEDIGKEISRYITKHGETNAYAVRSSATAEDLPTASFAGQQDTYLNVVGTKAIPEHVCRCWASLFTERAIIYRIQNNFDHRKVYLSVVVQKMIFPLAAGILFTADPVTYNRKVLSIDASFGLGEALVSGIVNADIYKVRGENIIDKKISNKKLAVLALKGGGTKEQNIDPEKQDKQTLTDEQILQLAAIGRKIEDHFGRPQDIEWCLADGNFYIVQSRPITTLYPIPEVSDGANHVYVSVGHQQMMTDPMKPLGLSFFLIGNPHMRAAGGRLFVDLTAGLSSPASRENMLDVLGQSDPLIKDALLTVLERGDFIKLSTDSKEVVGPIKSHKGMTAADIQTQAGDDPAIVTDLIRISQKAIDDLKRDIQTRSGAGLIDYILENSQQLKRASFEPKNLNAIMVSFNASAWLNGNLNTWLGEKNVADTLAQSVPNNVTSEMGLALLDVADAIRPYPEVIDYLQNIKDDDFLDGLLKFNGGGEIRNVIIAFLDKYGMRCTGEIDITRTRWSEKPATLVPLILGNIRNLEPGASRLKFERGRQESLKKEQEILDRLRQLPDGEQKAIEVKQMIDLLRNFAGYREYPKYAMVSRYLIYKQALLAEAARLMQANVIQETEDIYYLSLEELRDVIVNMKLDRDIINKRKDDYKQFEKLTPPRVLTSDGEAVAGKYKREDIPAGAIVGLAVSSGVIEGRARVILNMEEAKLEEGDILVTTFTDPSWTPLFVSIKGLITEVGGLTTHGAVIAREYGLPAVVGVANATKLISDGQRIRVNGTEGYVEVL